MAQLQETTKQREAEIRIFCDDDERWKDSDELPNAPSWADITK